MDTKNENKTVTGTNMETKRDTHAETNRDANEDTKRGTLMMKEINIMAVVDANYGLSHQGELPWNLPGDMRHFKKTTMKTDDPKKRNAILMGRKTWFALDNRPLEGRLNIVLSRNFFISESRDIKCCRSMHEGIEVAERDPTVEKIFVIGGAVLFEQCLKLGSCKRIFLTEICNTYPCDTFFPRFDKQLFSPVKLSWLDHTVQKEGDVEYVFMCYERQDKEKPLTFWRRLFKISE